MSKQSMNAAGGITRRGLFGRAGLAAIAGAAAVSLAGCGEGEQVAKVTANPTTQRVTTPDWLGEAPEINEDEITETIDVDVVVVGCGTGGIPAIISAAEEGARVLGIDQQAKVSNVREDIGAIDSALQKETEKEFPQFHIDKYEAMEDIVRYANGFVDYNLIKLWADESGAMVDWLTKICERNGDFRMWHEGSIGTDNGQARDRAWATGHSPEKLSDDKDLSFGVDLQHYAEELGAQFRFETSLVRCEQDYLGRVTGIICRDDREQTLIRVNAKKGVILATGGYVANNAMVEARQAWNNRLKINTAPGGSPTGDGIKAAMWCGADIDPIGCAVTFNRACCKPDETAGSDVKGKWWWFGEQPFLKVNLNGERFCNESGPYDYMLHSAFMQPDHTYVDIFDSNYAEQVRIMNEVGCCRLYPFDNGAPSNRGIEQMAADFENLEEAGYLMKADTIEELASKLNIPVDKTVESFNRYNEFARQGHDDDYNKEPIA